MTTDPKTAFDLAGVRHGFFGRAGGVSRGVYDSLNCGLGSADLRDAVIENRARVAANLGVAPTHLLTCHQIHSATAVVVDTPWSPDRRPEADALVTATPGLAVGALAADCAPVLFVDPAAKIVAAAHAGWKGAVSGVLESTVAAMIGLGARRERIEAALGPCISGANYEVGSEFEANFLARDPSARRFFTIPAGRTRAHFHLPAYVLARLASAGVGRIHDASTCTYADAAGYFSYRRTTHRREPDYGRQISAIAVASRS
jgi:hypothetical protein